jgi:hypothetical protein
MQVVNGVLSSSQRNESTRTDADRFKINISSPEIGLENSDREKRSARIAYVIARNINDLPSSMHHYLSIRRALC